MEIKSAEFVSSFASYKDCPISKIHEYAFVGRSNVGKSSLINMLLDKKKLAKTSQSPGKTQLINQFIVNDQWTLVDLPGYGFAKVAKSMRKGFSALINDYILKRENLVCVFVLIDSRHKPQKNDLGFMRWLGENQVPFCMVFTKSDKLSSSALNKNMKSYKNEMMKEWEALPDIFISSSEKKLGRDDILDYIDKLNRTVEL